MSRKKSAQLGKIFNTGDRIRKIRGRLTQVEFGKLFGVNGSAVSKWEDGRLSDIETLKKIADYGGVTVEWLLRGDQKAAIPEPLPEKLPLESPPPGAGSLRHDPYLFTGIDIDAMTRIIEQVEDHLERRKRPLKPVKKGLLISLLYDEFQKFGHRPDQAKFLEFLRQVE